ncbi:MAG: hypothetical protein HPY74_06390 [Firmicutes bacterium]|nr:hypothetical protein [Bacillota bacterium]
MIIKFLFKKEPLDKYDEFLKTLETKYNYKAYLDECEKQSKALGIIK